MADSTSVAIEAAPTTPSEDAIKRAAAFTREPFVLEGEDAAVQLAPGTARRRALDAALAELEAGAKGPSVAWRQSWSLLLGLDRLLCQQEPHLADGTVLDPHQVDALSGTLTALLAESGHDSASNGAGPKAEPAPAPLASVGIPGEEDLDDDDEPEEPQDWEDDSRRRRRRRGRAGRGGARIPTPRSASGSSMRPAPARRSRRSASSRARAPAAP